MSQTSCLDICQTEGYGCSDLRGGSLGMLWFSLHLLYVRDKCASFGLSEIRIVSELISCLATAARTFEMAKFPCEWVRVGV